MRHTKMSSLSKLKTQQQQSSSAIFSTVQSSSETHTPSKKLLKGNKINRKSASPQKTEKTAKKSTYLDGVVRVFCTHSEPNYEMPWQRQRQEFSTSSGFAIGGKRILTNAHSIEHGSVIQVKKRQSEKKYVAKVIAVGHQCDLALLQVDDDSFWEDVPAMKFGSLPHILDEVAVIGYPVGGDSMSITCGVVSRIEMQEYAQVVHSHLIIFHIYLKLICYIQ